MAKIKLYDYQEEIIFKSKQALEQNLLYLVEAPTGSGKSVILSELANYYMKQGKKVIVSTNTNQLVVELYNQYKKFYNEGKFDVVVGNDNYIDVKKFSKYHKVLDGEDMQSLFHYLLIERDITELESLPNHDLLIDVILENIEREKGKIFDDDIKKIFKQIAKNSTKKDYISGFDDNDISFTNHTYLLTSVTFNHLKDLTDEYVVLFDEAHTLNGVAEMISTNLFSPYQLRVYAKGILTALKSLNEDKKNEIKKTKTLINKMESFIDELIELSNKHNNMLVTGSYYIGNDYIEGTRKRAVDIVKDFKRLLEYDRKNRLLNRLKRKKEKVSNQHYHDMLSLFSRDLQDLRNIDSYEAEKIVVAFSNVKGFVSLQMLNKNYKGKLISFWKKLPPKIACFSATFTIDNSETDIKSRFNFIKKELGLLNEESTGKYTGQYISKPVFKKEQYNYHYVDKNFPDPVDEKEEWIDSVAKFVLDTYEHKNTLVLLGSFAEVDMLYDKLAVFNIDENVIKAERGKNIYTTIKEFKKSGGILIGTRNYGVGIDLKGKELEKLYIGKLPYPVLGLKYLFMQENGIKTYPLMVNGMLFNLKQWKGRLIRTTEDKGDVYVLDSRMYKKDSILRRVKDVIENI